jgi:protein-disulfide isomerase
MEKTKLLTILVTVTLVITVLNLFVSFDLKNKFDSITGKDIAGQDVQPTPTKLPVPKPTQPSKIQVSTGDDPIKGLENAPVTIIEFSDFECSYCEIFYTQTLPLIEKNYIKTGKVRLVYRDFPLEFHNNAQKAAEAAKCADEQGKFWEYHDTLFNNQKALDISSLMLYAKELTLNETTFNDCLNSGRMAPRVQNDLNDGLGYGISGTPTFFINGIQLVGAQPYSVFKQVIDKELNNTKS